MYVILCWTFWSVVLLNCQFGLSKSFITLFSFVCCLEDCVNYVALRGRYLPLLCLRMFLLSPCPCDFIIRPVRACLYFDGFSDILFPNFKLQLHSSLSRFCSLPSFSPPWFMIFLFSYRSPFQFLGSHSLRLHLLFRLLIQVFWVSFWLYVWQL